MIKEKYNHKNFKSYYKVKPPDNKNYILFIDMRGNKAQSICK